MNGEVARGLHPAVHNDVPPAAFGRFGVAPVAWFRSPNDAFLWSAKVFKPTLMLLVILNFACCIEAKTQDNDLSTPQKCWTSVLHALQSGKPDEVRRVTTIQGFKTLARSFGGKQLSRDFIRLGEGWKTWEIRWTETNSNKANALLGPSIKEHGLEFIRIKDEWKLNAWRPGD